MSDSVTKWHEMQEEKDFAAKVKALEKDKTYIYESPDGGKTVSRRPFGEDIDQREVILKPEIKKEVKRDAYTILPVYSEESIKLAAKILEVGE